MGKKVKAPTRSQKVFQNLEKMTLAQVEDGDEDTLNLLSIQGQAIQAVQDSSRLPRMKKFRFQLLHNWLAANFHPCKAADIGGGKGLLCYLLQKSSWQATVIDPVYQPLPDKYKDILTGSRVKIHPDEAVPHISEKFDPSHAQGFDLLIGLHAHGCNVKIIEASVATGCRFVIFPCCIIDEPFYPPLGVHWLESLAGYAIQQGISILPFRLNFKGQNIGLYGFHGSQVR